MTEHVVGCLRKQRDSTKCCELTYNDIMRIIGQDLVLTTGQPKKEILNILLGLIRVNIQNNTVCALEHFAWHYDNALKHSLCGMLVLYLLRKKIYNCSLFFHIMTINLLHSTFFQSSPDVC